MNDSSDLCNIKLADHAGGLVLGDSLVEQPDNVARESLQSAIIARNN